MEATSNQVGGVPKDLAREEAKVWAIFKTSLGLFDVYHPCLDQLTYTWDNHHILDMVVATPIQILKRLDHFYMAYDIL